MRVAGAQPTADGWDASGGSRKLNEITWFERYFHFIFLSHSLALHFVAPSHCSIPPTGDFARRGNLISVSAAACAVRMHFPAACAAVDLH